MMPDHENEAHDKKGVVFLRLSQEEKEIITRAAEIATGGNVSELARRVLLSEAKRIIESGGFVGLVKATPSRREDNGENIADAVNRSKAQARWAEKLYATILELNSLADEIRKSD